MRPAYIEDSPSAQLYAEKQSENEKNRKLKKATSVKSLMKWP